MSEQSEKRRAAALTLLAALDDLEARQRETAEVEDVLRLARAAVRRAEATVDAARRDCANVGILPHEADR